ncbi:hypothetical protein RCL1_005844 [Eukaryota sp. TZLM3-RCL]
MSPYTILTFPADLNNAVFGYHSTLFGDVFLVVSDDTLIFLGFGSEHTHIPKIPGLTKLERNQDATSKVLNQILINQPLTLLVQGTPFQVKVWKALCSIPSGETRSYGEIARSIGCPSAHRAVANAIGKNPVSYVIPCHRVIQSNGNLGGYRWGSKIKKHLLDLEKSM